MSNYYILYTGRLFPFPDGDPPSRLLPRRLHGAHTTPLALASAAARTAFSCPEPYPILDYHPAAVHGALWAYAWYRDEVFGLRQ